MKLKDELKNHYLILKFLMILNIVNAALWLIGKHITAYGILEYFWIAIGMSSLIALYFFLFKNSTAEKINVAQIKHLNEKSVFGRKRFSIELENGKKRVLGNFRTQLSIVEIRELFAKIGISIR